jgi:transposase-like protein
MVVTTSGEALHLLRLSLDTPSQREMSVAEQRYKAVLAVIANGRTVSEVAKDWGVSRQTMHAWLARYEAEGLEGLPASSRRSTTTRPMAGSTSGRRAAPADPLPKRSAELPLHSDDELPVQDPLSGRCHVGRERAIVFDKGDRLPHAVTERLDWRRNF